MNGRTGLVALLSLRFLATRACYDRGCSTEGDAARRREVGLRPPNSGNRFSIRKGRAWRTSSWRVWVPTAASQVSKFAPDCTVSGALGSAMPASGSPGLRAFVARPGAGKTRSPRTRYNPATALGTNHRSGAGGLGHPCPSLRYPVSSQSRKQPRHRAQWKVLQARYSRTSLRAFGSVSST
jgi:hypothetical protein